MGRAVRDATRYGGSGVAGIGREDRLGAGVSRGEKRKREVGVVVSYANNAMRCVSDAWRTIMGKVQRRRRRSGG